jgi:hypothetical protein
VSSTPRCPERERQTLPRMVRTLEVLAAILLAIAFLPPLAADLFG